MKNEQKELKKKRIGFKKKNIKTIFKPSIIEAINILEHKGVKFETIKTLEMFGRSGEWVTTSYSDKVKSLEVWEIDKKWEGKLKKNLPHATIKILDSIYTVKQNKNLPKFDLIVMDNPMNVYGPRNDPTKYCEHFDIIKYIGNLIDDEAIIIFNVNKKPFNYEKSPLWKKRREVFYGAIDTSNITLEFLFNFYKELFSNIGFTTKFFKNIERHMPHLDYFVYKLKRKKSVKRTDAMDWISLYNLFKHKR